MAELHDDTVTGCLGADPSKLDNIRVVELAQVVDIGLGDFLNLGEKDQFLLIDLG